MVLITQSIVYHLSQSYIGGYNQQFGGGGGGGYEQGWNQGMDALYTHIPTDIYLKWIFYSLIFCLNKSEIFNYQKK